MASNTPCEEIKCEESTSSDVLSHEIEEATTIAHVEAEQEKQKIQHCFSEPWEDSDVILVVEDEKFHVHRVILSMNSPVFKAMFKSQFKEATSNEVSLPGKKAYEMLVFLKKIYGFQYVKEEVLITMENVEYLLHLSDEYQVVDLIFNPCVTFLENQPKTKDNVMDILSLANLYDLEKVCDGCNDLLGGMKLETLSETVHLHDLDKEEAIFYLTQRIERLEEFLDELYPQFMGVVRCLIWVFDNDDKNPGNYVRWCTHHFSKGNLNFRLDISSPELKDCSRCCEMFKTLERGTYKINWGKKVHHYGGRDHDHFDDNLLSIIQDFRKLKYGL